VFPNQIADVDDADDVVEVAVVDRYPDVVVADTGLDGLLDGGIL